MIWTSSALLPHPRQQAAVERLRRCRTPQRRGAGVRPPGSVLRPHQAPLGLHVTSPSHRSPSIDPTQTRLTDHGHRGAERKTVDVVGLRVSRLSRTSRWFDEHVDLERFAQSQEPIVRWPRSAPAQRCTGCGSVSAGRRSGLQRCPRYHHQRGGSGATSTIRCSWDSPRCRCRVAQWSTRCHVQTFGSPDDGKLCRADLFAGVPRPTGVVSLGDQARRSSTRRRPGSAVARRCVLRQ